MSFNLSQAFKERLTINDHQDSLQDKSEGQFTKCIFQLRTKKDDFSTTKNFRTKYQNEKIENQRKLLLEEARKECSTPEFQKAFTFISVPLVKSHFYTENLFPLGKEGTNIMEFDVNQENSLYEYLSKGKCEVIKSNQGSKVEGSQNYDIEDLTLGNPLLVKGNNQNKAFVPRKPRRTTRQIEFGLLPIKQN